MTIQKTKQAKKQPGRKDILEFLEKNKDFQKTWKAIATKVMNEKNKLIA